MSAGPVPAEAGAPPGLPTLVGLSAVGFSLAYIVSDLLELAQGGFSPSSSRSPTPRRRRCRSS